jgi:hypothetical protein
VVRSGFFAAVLLSLNAIAGLMQEIDNSKQQWTSARVNMVFPGFYSYASLKVQCRKHPHGLQVDPFNGAERAMGTRGWLT